MKFKELLCPEEEVTFLPAITSDLTRGQNQSLQKLGQHCPILCRFWATFQAQIIHLTFFFSSSSLNKDPRDSNFATRFKHF